MYFKKLEIVGFKSFYHKTTLNFERGITAVVGPNGCGKSNIFDAIRWVLGEQSVKALRGSEMQDVIFNGTDSKEPLSMAEVALTFDNSSRFFKVEHDEVEVTRRIFRSGESEYLLNKTLVRLKDILDLLMGTGIGAESYSLVAQGKIDLILSSRPEDRRLVFDEAAGITKYKAQKREAARKLEETEQNLLRVNDIITEVKRQIGSLERQANKARRYQEVFEELKSNERALALLQKGELEKQRNELIGQLDQLRSRESQLSSLIAEQESLVNSRSQELKGFEDNILDIKNRVLGLENIILRNKERSVFNQERIKELASDRNYLQAQIEQTKNRLLLDEEKLKVLQNEYDSINRTISEKSGLLSDKETELNNISLAVKGSLEAISSARRGAMDLAAKISNHKNEITDLSSRQQINLARKKRLEIEKAKLNEEYSLAEGNLRAITQEVEVLEKGLLSVKDAAQIKNRERATEKDALGGVNSGIANLEKQSLTLQSHKEFLNKLKTEYEDISESMNAVVYLDKLPSEKVSGLVLKIKEYLNLSDGDRQVFSLASLKLAGEAKPIDLDTGKISQRIEQLKQELELLKNHKIEKEGRLGKLDDSLARLEEELRRHQMNLANKKAYQAGAVEQCDKIKGEQDIVSLEIADVGLELLSLEEKSGQLKPLLEALENEQKANEDLIHGEQNNIAANNALKEGAMVTIAKTRAEIEALNKRLTSDRDTLSIVEDACRQDKEAILMLEKQIADNNLKSEALDAEVKGLGLESAQAQANISAQNKCLSQIQEQYRQVFGGHGELLKKIDLDRKELDALKNGAHELEMSIREVDYKYSSIKDRLLQAYKIDLESIAEPLLDEDRAVYIREIERLKEKLDSYGTVNLVAIEEYDELKKRYDFLTQQQNDLVSAKESLREVILKINRTTKQMFLETFEKVRLEFRTYFRLLFNGGDAQVFLIDEQDPLESGIEIICRPPGKKLQNVLLLSGGEKAMVAIALIFAIFKVKPAPFCVLDEIDAALDEANVDRYSRLLQDFAKDSQFIAITHNKKTIVNADIMYGITMEESGVSKIVSVKFAQNKQEPDKQPDMVAA